MGDGTALADVAPFAPTRLGWGFEFQHPAPAASGTEPCNGRADRRHICPFTSLTTMHH